MDFEERFEKRCALLTEIFSQSGRNVGEAISLLVSSNDDYIFPTTNTDIQHDLCHVLANAVHGMPEEECLALGLQTVLLDGTINGFGLNDHVKSAIEQRGRIIKSFFASLMGDVAFAEIKGADLMRLPLGAFGTNPHPTSPMMCGKPQYVLMSAQQRILFYERFTHAAQGLNIVPQLSGEPFAEASANLL